MHNGFKRFLTGTLIASVFVLSGCSNEGVKQGRNQENDGPIKVVVWTQLEAHIVQLIDETLKGFEEENNIDIVIEKQDALVDKLTLAGRSDSKDSPDIVMGANDLTGKFAEMGVFEPIDSYIDPKIKEQYLATAIEAESYKGKLYGLPTSVETLIMMYNKKLVEKAPESTEELLAMMKEKTKNGQYGYVTNIYEAYFLSPWVNGYGGEFLSADAKASLNKPETLKGFELIEQMKSYLPEGLEYGLMDTLFKEGKAAVIMNGPWAISDYKGIFGEDLGLAKLPKVSGNQNHPAAPWVGVQGAMLMKNSANKEAAVKVIEALAGKEVSLAMAKQGGFVPAHNEAAADPSIQSDEVLMLIRDQAADGRPMPNAPQMAGIWDPTKNALMMILSKQNKPVKEIIDEAQRKAEEVIDNM